MLSRREAPSSAPSLGRPKGPHRWRHSTALWRRTLRLRRIPHRTDQDRLPSLGRADARASQTSSTKCSRKMHADDSCRWLTSQLQQSFACSVRWLASVGAWLSHPPVMGGDQECEGCEVGARGLGARAARTIRPKITVSVYCSGYALKLTVVLEPSSCLSCTAFGRSTPEQP